MSAIRRFRLLALAAFLATPAAFPSGTKGNAENGKAIFMTNACGTCHGVVKGENGKVSDADFQDPVVEPVGRLVAQATITVSR